MPLVRSAYESHVGAKVRGDLIGKEEQAQAPPGMADGGVKHATRTLDPARFLPPSLNGVTRNRRGGAQPEVAIGPGQSTVTVQELPIRENGADVGFGVQVVPRATDERLGVLIERPVELVLHPPGGAVVGRQHTDREATRFAGQLGAEVRIDQGTGVDQCHNGREVENLRPLHKKGPELGVEYGKALVHLDLCSVRLDL